MVSFENTRFDPDLTGFHAIAQQWHRRLDTPLICPLIPGWRSFAATGRTVEPVLLLPDFAQQGRK